MFAGIIGAQQLRGFNGTVTEWYVFYLPLLIAQVLIVWRAWRISEHWPASRALVLLSSGLLLVPLAALLQWRPAEDRRGAVIALSNVFVFSGVFAGSLSAWALSTAGISASGILIAASVVTVAATIWSLWLLPDALLRLIFVLLAHTFYRVRVIGRENVPQTGGALLVPNHASFVDGLFLLASLDRPIRFIVEATYYDHPLVKPFWKSIGAIPISASRGPRVVLRALRGWTLKENRPGV